MRKKVSAMLEIVVCDDDIADLERAVNMLLKMVIRISPVPSSVFTPSFSKTMADYIVTRNPADFKHSRVKVILPDELLRELEKN